MDGLILLITGWLLVAAAIAMLASYRLLLRHFDHHLLKMATENLNGLHTMLRQRMTIIDRWGISLTIGVAIYTALFLVYLLYQSFAKVAQGLLRLLSYI